MAAFTLMFAFERGTVKLEDGAFFLPSRQAKRRWLLPRLNDASGGTGWTFRSAKAHRELLRPRDRELTHTLLNEIQGILNWSIEGWRRLRERGAFVQPSCVEDTLRDMEDLSSPVGAFVRECCVVEKGKRVWVDRLYCAWKRWCKLEGRSRVTTRQTFGRDLMAAAPGISCRRNRDCGRFYEGIALVGGGEM